MLSVLLRPTGYAVQGLLCTGACSTRPKAAAGMGLPIFGPAEKWRKIGSVVSVARSSLQDSTPKKKKKRDTDVQELAL